MNIVEILFIAWFVFALGLSTYSMIFIIGLFIREGVNTIKEKYKGVYKVRWRKNRNTKPYPEDGETRIITRFLLFPKEINNEYRWLESVKIEQFYRGYDYVRDIGGFWVDKDWVDPH